MLDAGENMRRFRLHFEGPLTRDHTLPASALVQALEQFQRVVHLLAMAAEGREVKQRARVTHDIQRRFPLICQLPEAGGYALPIELGDTSHQLFDAQILQLVADQTTRVTRAINEGDSDGLTKLIPDTYFRRSVLNAFSVMQPARRSGVIVSIEDYLGKKILDGSIAQARIDQLHTRPEPGPAAAPAYLTGALIQMKFQERRLQLQLLGTGRALDATYSDDFEPVLLDHPRELIQVHGNVVYGEDGTPFSISDVDEILEVDESVIEVRTFVFKGRTLRSLNPLSFAVKFDNEEQLYEANGPFDVVICALTRPELEAQLDAELAMLWQEFALVEPDTLTSAAQRLREKLVSAFEEVEDAD